MSIVLLAAMILVADRATKEIALRKLGSRRHGHGVVCVVFTERPLLARGTSLRALVILWIAAGACAVGALLYAPVLQQFVFVAAGIAAALAGASGNLADRVIHGAVVDFVALGRWPVFNLADVAIVAGAVVVSASLIPIAGGR
ncbi:MAG: signal peptidase [Mycobacterium sp.]|nr:signal peptidase [Mycobacterium sp.]